MGTVESSMSAGGLPSTAPSSGRATRLAYSDCGSGERALVLMHGLLMNRHMFDRLAPEIASRGYRVITIDTLGHGASDRPEDMRLYNMPSFGEQIAAL